MVVLDTSILLFLFNTHTPSSIPRAAERVEYLIDQLSEAGEKIIIPTPVLAECLTKAGAGRSGLSRHHQQTIRISRCGLR
jgi:hypothetical protein